MLILFLFQKMREKSSNLVLSTLALVLSTLVPVPDVLKPVPSTLVPDLAVLKAGKRRTSMSRPKPGTCLFCFAKDHGLQGKMSRETPVSVMSPSANVWRNGRDKRELGQDCLQQKVLEIETELCYRHLTLVGKDKPVRVMVQCDKSKIKLHNIVLIE